MNKFEKGYDYIVKSRNGYWYIVRQTGQRSWFAMQFTNIDVHNDDKVRTGNSIALWSNLDPEEAYRYASIAQLKFRRDMFNVLKYGHTEGE